MTLLTDDRRYGFAVLGVCVLFTSLAFADDEDNSWMLAVAVAASIATTLIPDGLPTVQQLRERPHVVTFWSLLLALAVLAGIAGDPVSLLAGAAGALAAGYVAVLAVTHYVRSSRH